MADTVNRVIVGSDQASGARNGESSGQRNRWGAGDRVAPSTTLTMLPPSTLLGLESAGDRTGGAMAKRTAEEVRADREAAEASDGMACTYCDQYIGFSEEHKTIDGLNYHKSCAKLAR